jgi:hypothetical protein
MSYQNRLKEFFSKHDPDRIYLAAKIARTFRGDEDTVFKRLEEIYNTGGPTSLTYKEITPKPVPKNIEAHEDDVDSIDSNTNNVEPVKKKSGVKKLIFILLAVIVLGGGGYYGYTMFFTGHDDASADETQVSDEEHGDASHETVADEGHGNTHEDAETTHETHTSTDSTHTELTDSSHTESTDSTHTESTDSTIQDIKDAAEALHVLGM